MQQYVRGGNAQGAVGQPGQSFSSDGQSVPDREHGQTMQAAPPRFCRKCFLHEMELRGGLAESYRNMLERIEMMDPELRCMGEAYEARLAQCKKCEYLAEGMCGLCGCFAESRAAVKKNACPANPGRWEALE